MEVAPGTALRLWTEDAFAGRVTSPGTTYPSQVLNPKELNPQTGPFYVTGAEPGDTLAPARGRAGTRPQLGRVDDDPAVRRADRDAPAPPHCSRRCPN